MKHERHTAIRTIISGAPVANQDDLRMMLANRGIHVTQATLSRDIRELRLAKGPSGYMPPVDGEEDRLDIRQVLEGFAVEVRQAGNLLVLVTITGSAQPVAAGIDSEAWSEVIGTIAGDNTVLIICPDESLGRIVRSRIEGYIG